MRINPPIRKPFKYSEGQLLGSHGCKYVRDYDLTEGTAKDRPVRRAVFICGYCQSEFVCRIKSIKGDNTISCGCYFGAMISEVNQFRDKEKKHRYVCFDRAIQRYRVVIQKQHVGIFKDKEDAIKARNEYLQRQRVEQQSRLATNSPN